MQNTWSCSCHFLSVNNIFIKVLVNCKGWNIVESGVKHHNTNHIYDFDLLIMALVIIENQSTCIHPLFVGSVWLVIIENHSPPVCGVRVASYNWESFTPCLWGPCGSSFYFFLLSYYVYLRSDFRVVMSITISATTRKNVVLFVFTSSWL